MENENMYDPRMKAPDLNIIPTMFKVGIGVGLAALLFSLPGRKEEEPKDTRLPEVAENQQLVLHPNYTQGNASLGYTLLTDMNYSGDWDLAERVHVGFTPGDSKRELIYKKGFGPARSVEADVSFVDTDFFRAYE